MIVSLLFGYGEAPLKLIKYLWFRFLRFRRIATCHCWHFELVILTDSRWLPIPLNNLGRHTAIRLHEAVKLYPCLYRRYYSRQTEFKNRKAAAQWRPLHQAAAFQNF